MDMRHSQPKNENKAASEWIRTDSLQKYSPITEVYGVCFDSRDQILTCSEKILSSWQLPGGSLHNGESVENALSRHFRIKTCIEIRNLHYLGVLKFQSTNTNENDKPEFYKAIIVCEVHDMLPLVDDPETGKTWLQEFIPFKGISKFISNDNIPAAVFKDSIQLLKSFQRSKPQESLTFLKYTTKP